MIHPEKAQASINVCVRTISRALFEMNLPLDPGLHGQSVIQNAEMESLTGRERAWGVVVQLQPTWNINHVIWSVVHKDQYGIPGLNGVAAVRNVTMV